MKTIEERQAIAATILDQLGGAAALIAMTGANNFVATDSGLRFRIPRGRHPRKRQAVNVVQIDLTAADDYTVRAYFVRRTSCRQLEERRGIYCDQLKDAFESMTGLYLELPRFVS